MSIGKIGLVTRFYAFLGLAALAVAAGLVVAPPTSFGPRVDFLIYQTSGLAAGTIFRFVVGIALMLFALSAFRSSRYLSWSISVAPSVYWACLLAFPSFVFASVLATVPWAVCAGADASGYLSFHVFRTIGYPLFLAGTASLFGDFAALYPLQLWFLLASMSVLAHAVGAVTNDRRLALIVSAFMVGDVSLLAYIGMIAPEALFASLLCLHLAAILLALRRQSASLWTAAGLALGAAILVRPAGYAFLAATPALLMLLQGRRIVYAAVIVLGVCLPLLAASAINASRGGSFATQRFGGIAVLGMVVHLVDAQMPSTTPDLVAEIAAQTAPDAAHLRTLRIPHDQWRTTMNAYNDLLWRRAYPAIEAWVNARLPDASASTRQAAAAQIAGNIALEAIRYDPIGFGKQFVSHFYGMWLLSFLPHGPFAERIATCGNPALESLVVPKLDPALRAAADARRDALMPVDLFWAAATLLQFPAVAIALAASFASLVLPFTARRKDPVVGALTYAGLGAGAYVCMFAVAQVALPRYAVVMEPWLICLIALAFSAFRIQQNGKRVCAA